MKPTRTRHAELAEIKFNTWLESPTGRECAKYTQMENMAVLDGDGLHYKGKLIRGPKGREIFNELIEV